MKLEDLDESFLGASIRVMYTQIEGELTDFNLNYGDDVKIVVGGEVYYLPREYPFAESVGYDDYDPSVLLGVVEPWSPFQGL